MLSHSINLLILVHPVVNASLLNLHSLPPQTPAPSAPWCPRPLCVSSWRWSDTTPSSWAEQSGTTSPSPPPPPPARPLRPAPPPPPHPFSVRPFAKRSPQRAWEGSWRCSWRPRCSPASSRRGICAARASEVPTCGGFTTSVQKHLFVAVFGSETGK